MKYECALNGLERTLIARITLKVASRIGAKSPANTVVLFTESEFPFGIIPLMKTTFHLFVLMLNNQLLCLRGM